MSEVLEVTNTMNPISLDDNMIRFSTCFLNANLEELTTTSRINHNTILQVKNTDSLYVENKP